MAVNGYRLGVGPRRTTTEKKKKKIGKIKEKKNGTSFIPIASSQTQYGIICVYLLLG